MDSVDFQQAYYVKLGRGGMWEKDSIETGKVRIGWDDVPLADIHAGRWDNIRGIVKKAMPGSAGTHDFNTLKTIVQSSRDDLWVSFYDSKLWWCRVDGAVHEDGVSKYRPVQGQWHDADLSGRKLFVDHIGGRLLRLRGYRATICNVRHTDELRRLINVQASPELAAVEAAVAALVVQVEAAIRTLHWRDFELLVDLLFRSAGWRRISILGETVKFTDMNLEEPVTGDKYQVQVKSASTLKEFESYRSQFNGGLYRRMYFVVHSPDKALKAAEGDDKVHLIHNARLARMVVDAGLVGWLMEKVR